MTTGRFIDPGGFPLPAPKERPLRPQLPTPPIVDIGGVECVLEYVRIDDLATWARKHHVERLRTAFMGRLGHVNLYWPSVGHEEDR